MQDVRKRLLDTETEIEKLKAASGLSDAGTGSNINVQQITELNTQLGQARSDVLEKQTR